MIEWTLTAEPGRVVENVAIAHKFGPVIKIEPALNNRIIRDQNQRAISKNATRSWGAGNREVPCDPDEFRTCFEVDRDRILHSKVFRRLAGKTQVFIFPKDHQRTRLTHALEVAQVAKAIALALGLNSDLAEAAALAHDCGHGPGGHYSEEAFSSYIPGGFDHATWGADVALKDLNLCLETLDAVRNHSWSRPSPNTPEGVIISWADRIAYLAHDFEDATSAGIIDPQSLPKIVKTVIGTRRSEQINNLINAMITTVAKTGLMGLDLKFAEALTEFRKFNTEKIYRRKESLNHGQKVKSALEKLIDYLSENPGLFFSNYESLSEKELLFQIVKYINGMTDKYAFSLALKLGLISKKDLPETVS